MIPQKGKKVTLGQLGAMFSGGTGGRKKSVSRSSSSSCAHTDIDKKNSKKKKGSEKSVSSMQEICHPPVKPVVELWNEDIAKMSIKRNPWQKHQGILVKKKPTKKMNKFFIKKFKPKTRGVVVSYPAEKSAPCKPYLGQSNPCIKFDKDGHIIPYCILGTEEEFIKQSSKGRQLIPQEEEEIRDYEDSSEFCGSSTKQIPQSAYLTHVDEKRALRVYKESLVDRKNIRKRLAVFTKRDERDLVMSDDFGQLEAGKKVTINHGKPNFWDTEKTDTRSTRFWKLSTSFGREIGVCHSTLTQAEQGFSQPSQLIGFPLCTVQERVLGSKTKIPTFYSTPDTTKLYMKGTTPGGSICVSPGWENVFQDEEEDTIITPREMEFWNKQLYVNPDGTWKSFSTTNDADSPSKIPVITITGDVDNGPSMRVCGQEAKWYPTYKAGRTVHAEAGGIGPINEIIYFNVNLDNCGSTSLFYEWQKLDKERSFGILRKSTERFYFNDHRGTLIPGSTKTVPCMFKSPTSGSFSEQWKLITKPNLCGQGDIILTLWGLATTEDIDINNRKSIDDHLSERMKETAVKFTLDSILDRVCTPVNMYFDRNIPPTGSDLFQYRNKLPYNSVHVHDLLQLANIVDPTRKYTRYNISIKRLNNLIRRKELEDDLLNEDDPDNPIVVETGKESLLKELNTIISKLIFPSFIPSLDRKSEICRGMLSDSVDKFVDVSQRLKEMYGVKIEKVIHCIESVQEPAIKKLAKEGKEKKGSGANKTEKPGSRGSKSHATVTTRSPVARPPPLTETIYILKEDPKIYKRYCDKLYIACQVILVELVDSIEEHFSCLN